MSAKIPEEKLDAAIAELKKVRRSWLRRPGVTGVDVGLKMKGRELTDELAVRVHVSRKVPVSALPNKAEAFAESGKPQKLGDFDIDVIEAEYGLSDHSAPVIAPEELRRIDRVEPLVGGVSVGNAIGGGGTLGAIVWDKTDGELCILSNWHVLCRRKSCQVGEAIYQPSSHDGGRRRDRVAELKRWRLNRNADAALARLTGARPYAQDILGLTPIAGMEDPELGMQVVKSGRTTQVTKGQIDGLAFAFNLNYADGSSQTFDDQIHIIPRPPWPSQDYELSEGGDSGSLWINEATGMAVGLHFAGETNHSISAEHSIANRIKKVAKELEFSFAPVYRPPVPENDRVLETVRRVFARHHPELCTEPAPDTLAPLDRMLQEVRDEMKLMARPH